MKDEIYSSGTAGLEGVVRNKGEKSPRALGRFLSFSTTPSSMKSLKLKGMKRPAMSVAGRAVGGDDLRTAVANAATGWLRERRHPRPAKPKRAHRALTDEEREAKAQRTQDATRPFRIEGPFAWSFEVAKATEFNLGAGIRWLREQAATAFNAELRQEGLALRYSGRPQARRGVPASGETHDGPAATARRRKHDAEEEERRQLAEKIAAFLAGAVKRAIAAGEKINELAAAPAVAATGLQALRDKFRNPLELKQLSMTHLLELSDAEMAADDWFGPALELRLELQRRPHELVIERDGLPAIDPATLDRRHAAILSAPSLPDIVQEQLEVEYQQLVRQRQQRKKRQSEYDRIRRERLKWLKGAPIAVFDIGANVLPDYRGLFPPAVMAMPGVREAMMECHLAWMREEKARKAPRVPLETTKPPRAIVHQPISATVGEPDLGLSQAATEEGLSDELLQEATKRGFGRGFGPGMG